MIFNASPACPDGSVTARLRAETHGDVIEQRGDPSEAAARLETGYSSDAWLRETSGARPEEVKRLGHGWRSPAVSKGLTARRKPTSSRRLTRVFARSSRLRQLNVNCDNAGC